MKHSGPFGVILMAALCVVCATPTRPTPSSTTRSAPPIGNATKKLVSQQEDNSTTQDMVLDIRTPPKVKQQVQNKMKIKEEIENSHAGVAIPIDEDSIEMEETTKKLNFYKIERPTTNSGLSTWILLSGQASTTTTKSPFRKPVVKPTSDGKLAQETTASTGDKPVRTVKPIFKQRSTTTQKPTTTTNVPTTTTFKDTTKLTKVKASILNNVNKKYNNTVVSTIKKAITTTTPTTTQSAVSTMRTVVKQNITSENVTLSSVDSSTLPLEAKNGEAELPEADNKKKKTSTKRKKNKTRRRKPSDKDSNSTSIAKPTKHYKENPIGTQLYNYLAREIMPTVGVGLVGLMVTAGLASYFLYPFGAARRTFEVDRKDKEGSYYYNDEYSGGMPEEEAIGKVIAGMPGNSLYANSYKSPSRNTYVSTKYRLVDRRAEIQKNPYSNMVQGTVENVPISSVKQEDNTYSTKQVYQTNNYEPVSYNSNLDTKYTPSDSKFVVGNVIKDTVVEATPAAVPEHGPRNLNFPSHFVSEPAAFVVEYPPKKISSDVVLNHYSIPKSRSVRRKRSDFSNDMDNEIFPIREKEVTTTTSQEDTTITETTTSTSHESPSRSTTQKPRSTTSSTLTTTNLPDRINSFIDLVKELLHYKAKIGLQLIQNATQSISKYISRVQTRLDEHYRQYTKNRY